MPTKEVFAQAGEVLRLLQSRRGYSLGGGHWIANDVLIALSARSLGATVVTANADGDLKPSNLQLTPDGHTRRRTGQVLHEAGGARLRRTRGRAPCEGRR